MGTDGPSIDAGLLRGEEESTGEEGGRREGQFIEYELEKGGGVQQKKKEQEGKRGQKEKVRGGRQWEDGCSRRD